MAFIFSSYSSRIRFQSLLALLILLTTSTSLLAQDPPPPPPLPPANVWLTLANGGNYVIVHWSPVAGATNYEINVALTPQWTGVSANVPAPGTSYTIYASRGYTYYCGVIAVAEHQGGSLSNLASIAAIGSGPPPPKNNAEPSDSPCCSSPCGQGVSSDGSSYGDPVSLTTGAEAYEPQPDMTVYNPSGPAVSFTRNYRSDRALSNLASPGLSAGWGQSYDVSVQGQSGSWGGLTLTYPNGAQETLTPTLNNSGQPTGAFSVPAGSSYSVTGTPGGTAGQWQSLILTWSDRTKWLFAPGSGGYVLSQITNPMGKSLSLSWSGSRQLNTITDVTTGVTLLTLSYDGNGNLTAATDPYGRKVVYTFGIPAGFSTMSLLTTSEIAPSSQTTPPARWTYSYTNLGGQPLLSSISVPSAAGSGVSTSSIHNDTAGIGSKYPTGRVTSLVDANGNQRVYTYNTNDANNQYIPISTQIQVEDKNNNVVRSWTQNFDGSGRDTGITFYQPDGTTVLYQTSLAYGDSNNPNQPTSVTDANGHTTQYSYDQFGNLLTVTPQSSAARTPAATAYHYTYTPFSLGELQWIQEGSKPATNFFYKEPSGLITEIDSPVPGTVGGSGVVKTTFTYDDDEGGLGNLRTVTTPGNGTVASKTTTYEYLHDSSYDASGNAGTGYTVPAAQFGQPLTIKDNAGNFSHFRYDTQGHPLLAIDALGNRTDYNFIEAGQSVSLAGQIQSVISPATGQTGSGRGHTNSAYQYPGGPLSGVTSYDEGNVGAIRQVNYAYGPEGELLKVTGSTEPVTYTYDALYRLSALQDAALNTTTYFYNPAGNLYQTVYPGAQTTPPTAPLAAGHADTVTFPSYDPAGNALQRVDGNNLTTTYIYNDPESLLTDITYPTGTIGAVHFNYDAYGRRGNTTAGAPGMTDGTGSQSYAYDDDDNLISHITAYTGIPAQTLTYAYYPDGSRQTLTTSQNSFGYTYDSVGRMSSLTNPYNQTASWTYLYNGWLNTQTLGNGAKTTYTRNALGEVTRQLTQTSALATLSDFGGTSLMTYDGMGNRLTLPVSIPAVPTLGGTTNYTYDYGQTANPALSRSQLTQESSNRNGNYTYNYGYDGSTAGGPGNPTSFQGTANTFNADNQNTNGFTNDGNGNQSDPTHPYAYDPENRLTNYYAGAFTAAYDGDGQLAWKQNSSGTRTYFVYDGDTPLLGLSGTGAVVNVFTFGGNGLLCERINGVDGFLTFDPSGNTVQSLSSSQSVNYSHLVTGFGSQLSGGSTSDAYDGLGAQWGYRRESGNLFLLGHRYYSSQRGQFLTRDPMGYGGGVNLYGYVGNDPVSWIDPQGHNPAAIALTIVALGGGPEDPVGDIVAGVYIGAVGSAVLYNYLWDRSNAVSEQDGSSAPSQARAKDVPRRKELPLREGDPKPNARRIFRRCPTRGRAEKQARDSGNGPPEHDKPKINDKGEFEPGHYHPTRPDGKGGYERIPDGVHWLYPPFK